MIEQRTKEWFNQRSGRVTASAVGAILGLAPFTTRKDVLTRMIREYQGFENEFKGNVATEYGTFNEDGAIKEFEIETGLTVENAPFVVSKDYDWIGASPDGYVSDNSLIEVKCPYGLRNGGEFKSIDDQKHYYAQMQLQMFCTEYEKCYFYQWSPHGSKLELVKRDNDFIFNMLIELEKFYLEYKDNRDNKLEFDEKEIIDIMEAYIKNKETINSLTDINKQLLESMIVLTDENGGQIGEHKLIKSNRKGSISYQKIVKDHLPDLDLEQYRGKESEVWSVR